MNNNIFLPIIIIILLMHKIHVDISNIKERHFHSEIENIGEILVNNAGYVTSGTNEYVRVV